MGNIQVVVCGSGGAMGQLIVDRVMYTIGMEVAGKIDPDENAEDAYRSLGLYLGNTERKADVVVDFTTSLAAHHNVKACIENNIPFVVGTTKWDQSVLEGASVTGVVAPNMSPRLVAIQYALELIAANFPHVFDGFDCRIDESHQKAKEGPSGTGDEWGKIIANMGAEVAKIRPHRDKEEPHAYHVYDLVKGAQGRDATRIQIITDIDGRNEYLDGVIAAIRYAWLYKDHGKVYSMVDVLKDPNVW